MPEVRLPLVLLCFLLSGFAALLYQTAWTQEFAVVFGTTELAVATVLAAYMGGLALGSAVGGRFAQRVRRPVLVYGLLELGIAGSALVVPLATQGATRLCAALFGGGDAPPPEGGPALLAFYLAASAIILGVPTALMGATLPLLARHAVRSEQEIGPRVGLLYAANTAGAVLGTVCAGFVLLPALGLRHTVWIGAAINAGVFGLAALLALRAAPLAPVPPTARGVAAEALGGRALILPFMLVSGATSFTYEVLWTRLLGHILGGSVYAFSTMLASFLLGIALGSAVASRLATTARRAAYSFGAAQLGVAALTLVAFQALDVLPELARLLGAGARGGPARNAALAALLLLPSALFIGATFPLAVRVLARGELDAGPATARVYAWNTVGAIVGAVSAGFFSLPGLGYQGTLVVGLGANLALALAAGLVLHARASGLAVLACAGLIALALFEPGPPEALLRMSPMNPRPLRGAATYYGVGRSATILLIEKDGLWKLRSNGLPESSILPPGHLYRDRTAWWLAALPVLARPNTRSMLAIGLGGGSMLERVPRGVESIEVIELEAEVIAANRAVAAQRARDPLSDPRVHLTVNDARGALLLTTRRWDAIVSQPSHPWTAAAAHLYTREFFELVREHLTPRGVFVQWMGLGFVDEDLLRTLLATLRAAFPHVRLYLPPPGALVFLASDAPLPVETTAAAAIAGSPEEFAAIGVFGPEDAALALALDEDGARRFAAGAAVSTDDRNLLQMRAPRVLANPLGRGVVSLFAPLDPLAPPPDALDAPYLVRSLLADGQSARARRLAESLPEPLERRLARGLVNLATGQARRGVAALRNFPTGEAGGYEAQVALMRTLRTDLLRPGDEGQVLLAPLPDPAAAVAEGWRREARGAREAVEALEPRLARAVPHDAAFVDATRLRVDWRLAAGGAERAREAVALLNVSLDLAWNAPDLLRRARALAAAGNAPAALATLSVIGQMRDPEGDAVAQALSLLGRLALEPKRTAFRRRVEKQLRRHLEGTAG